MAYCKPRTASAESWISSSQIVEKGVVVFPSSRCAACRQFRHAPSRVGLTWILTSGWGARSMPGSAKTSIACENPPRRIAARLASTVRTDHGAVIMAIASIARRNITSRGHTAVENRSPMPGCLDGPRPG